MAQANQIQKAAIVIGIVRNWYMLLFDKLNLVKSVKYRFRMGATLYCRSKSTDINEACAIFSGLEYPEEICRFGGVQQATVFDLGGNIGAFAVWLAATNPKTELHVFAFEPHPGNAQLLRRNCAANGITDCEVFEVAIAGSSGAASLDVSGGFDAFRLNANAQNAILVDCITIGEFIVRNNIGRVDLLKMDVEGAEFDIIERDVESLGRTVVRMIVEYHGAPASEKVADMVSSLQQYFDLQFEQQSAGGGIISCRSRIDWCEGKAGT